MSSPTLQSASQIKSGVGFENYSNYSPGPEERKQRETQFGQHSVWNETEYGGSPGLPKEKTIDGSSKKKQPADSKKQESPNKDNQQKAQNKKENVKS